MKTITAICLAALLLSGCGIFKHQQQTYYVQEVLEEGVSQPMPILHVQIVPSVESTHIPLLYHSRTWGGPYRIDMHANPQLGECTHFLLHSFRLTSEVNLVDEKLFTTPHRMNLCGPKPANRNHHELYSYQIDDSFEFVEGRKIELEVRYERPDGQGVRTLLFRGIGEEEKSVSPLFSAYMSV